MMALHGCMGHQEEGGGGGSGGAAQLCQLPGEGGGGKGGSDACSHAVMAPRGHVANKLSRICSGDLGNCGKFCQFWAQVEVWFE